MDIDQLLTATRSARRSLDLDAPVDLKDIRECLRLARLENAKKLEGYLHAVIAGVAADHARIKNAD